MFRCSIQSGTKKIILAKSGLRKVKFKPREAGFMSHKWFFNPWYFKIQGDEANCHKTAVKPYSVDDGDILSGTFSHKSLSMILLLEPQSEPHCI